MSKNKKAAILLILAVVFAFVAACGVYWYCESSKGIVYIFNDSYSAGTQITKDMFLGIKVDEKIINAGKTADIDSYYITGEDYAKVVAGTEYLLNDVSKGKAFVFTDLAVTSGNAIERKLEDGQVAVTIPISGVAAVTDDLRVGSVVNIFTTSAEETSLAFSEMKIASLTKNGDSISSVTFLLRPEESSRLIHIANNETLYFGLMSPTTNAETK